MTIQKKVSPRSTNLVISQVMTLRNSGKTQFSERNTLSLTMNPYVKVVSKIKRQELMKQKHATPKK